MGENSWLFGRTSFQTKLTTLTDQSVYIEIYCNMHHLGISGELRTRIYIFKGGKISKPQKQF